MAKGASGGGGKQGGGQNVRNLPSKTGNPSGKIRGNNSPKSTNIPPRNSPKGS